MKATKRPTVSETIKDNFTKLDLTVDRMRRSIESLTERMESNDRLREQLNSQAQVIAGLNAKLETLTPIVEVLLHQAIKPGFKHRLIGEGFREVFPHHNQDTQPWRPR